jgi:hypothetical protein
MCVCVRERERECVCVSVLRACERVGRRVQVCDYRVPILIIRLRLSIIYLTFANIIVFFVLLFVIMYSELVILQVLHCSNCAVGSGGNTAELTARQRCHVATRQSCHTCVYSCLI